MQRAIDPSNGQLLRELPFADEATIEAALAAAAAAASSWGRAAFAERATVLRDVARLMREDVEQLAPLMTEEMGKPIREARGEVEKAAWAAEHYAEHAEAYLAPQTLASDATRSYVQHLPLGTVLGVMPWNAPFWLAFRFCAPALMAGNSCLLKHDAHVPACAEAIGDLFARVDAPEGLFRNLPMDHDGVAAVLRDPRVHAVSYTGSERGGAAVAAAAAAEIKPSVLELGGSDPCIVLADADLEAAADVITTSRIINAGQSCIAAKRIIVEASVHDRLAELLEERLGGLTLGDPREQSTAVGPIARADLRDNLHRQVSESIAAGASCRLGGELPDGPGFYYPVTLLTEVTPTMTVAREETFGPVMVLLRAADEEEALTIANDTPYGLAGSFWTDAARGEALAARLATGQVAVNGIVKTDPRLPSGGIKRSGIGRELGPHGIHAFVNAQQLWVGPRRDN
jgi:succinate-semialdehyde dehydrogenase/glutarate-semialdehyde dehydrogenase